MCWRIVRIEGDGSTKLILEDYNTTCNSSTFTGNWSDGNTYTFGLLEASTFVGGGLADAFKTFQTSKLNDYTSKLKSGDWCFDDTVTSISSWGYDDNYNTVYTESEATNGWYIDKYHGAYTRIYTDKKPSLNCTGTKLTKYGDGTTDMYVATLTADEVVFAGAMVSSAYYSTINYNYYLMNYNASSNGLHWWTISPSKNGTFTMDRKGEIYNNGVNNNEYARPAVSLKSNTTISAGTGIQTDPYIVE